MSQIDSSDLLVKNSLSAAIEPLEDGLCSINKVYEALIDGDVDPISGQSSNYNYIREQIVQAQQSLERSEQAASTELKCCDENIEILTQDEGKLEEEMGATKQTLDNLKTEQTSNINLLKQSEDALEQAKTNLNSTRDTLWRQQERKRNAKIAGYVLSVVFVIPVVGWIAGSIMAHFSEKEIERATDAVRSAEEEVRNLKAQVEKYRSKVSEYEAKISQMEHDIREKHDKVDKIHEEIQKVKEQRETVADLQEKVRGAVHVLSVLSGKHSVAERQTRKFIHQGPLMKVMEDLMKAVEKIIENQHLSTEGIPKLINAMKENHRKLAAICDSLSNTEDEGD